jgi:hypothetical protein
MMTGSPNICGNAASTQTAAKNKRVANEIGENIRQCDVAAITCRSAVHTAVRRSPQSNDNTQTALYHTIKKAAAGQKWLSLSTTMPSKRPTLTDNMSPQPTHRTADGNEHHHSPLPGHQPELPADAAVANASPQSKRSKENEMPMPPTINSTPNISPDDETAEMAASVQPPSAPVDLLTLQPSSITAVATAMVPTTNAGGGARAAFLTAQQQRNVTCNLSLLPLRKCARSCSPYL